MCYPVGDFSFGSAPTLSSARSPAPNTLFEPPWPIIAASERPARAAAVANPPRAANARRSRPPGPRRWSGPPRSRPTPDPRASAPRAHADRSSGRRAPRRSPPPPASGSAFRAERNRHGRAGALAISLRAPDSQHDPLGLEGRSATSSATSSLRAQPAKRRSREHSRHTEMTERRDIIRFAGTPPGRKERGLSPDLPLAWIQGQRIVGTPSAKTLAPWLNR